MRVYNNQPLVSLLEKAQNIHILVSPLLGEEVLVSGLALKAILEPRKKVQVLFTGTLSDPIKTLPNGRSVTETFPPKDITISFDISESPIEKVSYYLENKTFNLVIKPQAGRLDVKDIKFSSSGIESDLFVILGSRRLSDLGRLYESNNLEFAKIPIVNIDYHQDNEQFGQVNIVDEQALGVSEIIFANLGLWGLRPNYEAAQCLLFGLGLLKDLQLKKDQPDPIQRKETLNSKIDSPLEPTDNSYLGPPKVYRGSDNAS